MSIFEILPFLLDDFLGQPLWMWSGFFALITALIIFDLGVLNRRDHVMGVRESFRLTLFYVTMALIFGIGVYSQLGREAAIAYYTAYVIEQSLSLDNIFVISVIMGYFAVPRAFQHRILFWGIVGVIVLRGLVIGFGTALVHEFDWILLIFAVLLIYTGVKMLSTSNEKIDLDQHFFIRFLRHHLNVTPDYHGRRFFVRLPDGVSGRSVWFVTPLFLALVTVELADVIFAFDSLPAVLSITTDPFVVFSSNLFAIMGLRALYFALAAMLDRFHYLKYSLAFVLTFIGLKVFYHHLPDSWQVVGPIDPLWSLMITVSVLMIGILYSVGHVRLSGREVP